MEAVLVRMISLPSLLVRIYSYLPTQAESIIFLFLIGVELYTARQDGVPHPL